MTSGLQTQNDPAATAIAPGPGSHNSREEIAMNSNEITTDFWGTKEHPVEETRSLMKQLSEAMTYFDHGHWYCHVLPATSPFAEAFGALPHSHRPDELAVDKINRLAIELSDALNDWQGGTYQAVVLPSATAGNNIIFVRMGALRGRLL
jgi:hypothetical protein